MTGKSLAIALLASLWLLGGCAKAGEEYLHDNCDISAIEISNFNAEFNLTIQGTINQETGEILFAIPKKYRQYFDITQLYVKANISYDAVIEPPLTGLKDLSRLDDPFRITVTATMTGRSREYTLKAYYSRDYE